MLRLFSSFEQESNSTPTKKAPAFFMLALVGILFISSILSFLINREDTRQVKNAKEAVECFYLKRLETVIPTKEMPFLSPTLQRYIRKRVAPVLREYQEDVSTRVQVTRWAKQKRTAFSLHVKPDLPKAPESEGCVRSAVARDQLSRNPREFILLRLAKLKQQEIEQNQRRLEGLLVSYRAAREGHLFRVWGVKPKSWSFLQLLSASFVQPTLFTSFWQILFLFFLGSMLERRWGAMLLSFFFFASGSLFLLWFGLAFSKYTFAYVGTGGAFAGLLGLWFADYGSRSLILQFGSDSASWKKQFKVNGAWPILLWVFLCFIDLVILRAFPLGVFSALIIVFCLFAGGLLLVKQLSFFDSVESVLPLTMDRLKEFSRSLSGLWSSHVAEKEAKRIAERARLAKLEELEELALIEAEEAALAPIPQGPSFLRSSKLSMEDGAATIDEGFVANSSTPILGSGIFHSSDSDFDILQVKQGSSLEKTVSSELRETVAEKAVEWDWDSGGSKKTLEAKENTFDDWGSSDWGAAEGALTIGGNPMKDKHTLDGNVSSENYHQDENLGLKNKHTLDPSLWDSNDEEKS